MYTLSRTFGVDILNSIANHPEVIEGVSLQKDCKVDLKNKIEDLANIFILVSRDNIPVGNLAFYRVQDGVYEIHASFVPGHTSIIYRSCRDTINMIFREYGCKLLVSKIPIQNKKASKLFRGLGATYSRTKDGFDYYYLGVI